MDKSNPWLTEAKSTITPIKRLLSNLSIKVRTGQYEEFKHLLNPKPISKILDVGIASDDSYKDTNMFEKLYPYQKNITAITIENSKIIRKKFPKIKVIKIIPGKKLPFKNKQFDVVTSWATVEHVGGYENQKKFMEELDRVGEKIFVTTPYRGCIYEPHSGLFFLHWLPLKLFRRICIILGKQFWSTEDNLNPLYIRDIQRMKENNKIKTRVFKMFNILPSHILIYKNIL